MATEVSPPELAALLDYAERPRVDDWSLRAALTRYAQPQPQRASDLIEVMRRVIDEMHMAEVQIAYGMTETSPVSLQTGPDDELELRVTTVGRTQPRLENKIIDAEGATVPRGQIGELCTRGYSVMLGYWNNPKATAESIDADALLELPQ